MPTRLQLGFSHLLHVNTFQYGFRDILNPLCPLNIKTTRQYLLHDHFYNTNRFPLMNEYLG